MKLKQLLIPGVLPVSFRTTSAKRVGSVTLAGLLLALLYIVLASNWYQSTLTVVPAAQSKGAGFGAQLAGALGGALDIPGDLGGNADVERIAAVLQSTSVTDAVISKFNLITRYDERYIEHTRKRLWSHCTSSIDRKAKLVSLTCEDKDPHFVQRMLAYFGEYGNEVFRRVSTSSATEEVKFLERRVAEMRKEADDSALRLRDFEEKYKVVDLEAQSKAVVSAMASLRSQQISKDLQLSYLSTFSSRDEATASQLRQQLAVMTAKYRKLEESSPLGMGSGGPEGIGRGEGARIADVFPPALAVPKLRFEMEQLFRDKKIREADLLLLMQRLEMAKVNEARDTSAFQILDAPPVPTYKARPRRSLALLAGVVIGLMVGLTWAYGRRLWILSAGNGSTDPNAMAVPPA